MKYLYIVLIIAFIKPSDMDLENLLGKHISKISFGNVHFNSTVPSGNKIYTVMNFESDFFSEPYDVMAITTDKNGIIDNIHISIDKLLDRELYDKIVAKYGTPDGMFKPSSRGDKVTTIIDTTITAQSTKGSLEACSFEENPLWIRWEKPNFKIELILQREVGQVDIRISSIMK